MKYLFIFFISGLAAACNNTDKKTGVNADTIKKDSIRTAALKDTANFTTIQWLDSVDRNLGTIKEGQVVEIAWHFRNTGNKPLYIGSVRPGCGCTVAEQPTDAIAPGKEGIIKAKFNSDGHPNFQHKDVYIEANNSNKNNGTNDILRFSVNVTPK